LKLQKVQLLFLPESLSTSINLSIPASQRDGDGDAITTTTTTIRTTIAWMLCYNQLRFIRWPQSPALHLHTCFMATRVYVLVGLLQSGQRLIYSNRSSWHEVMLLCAERLHGISRPHHRLLARTMSGIC
jgi:hypothetical protein